MNGSGGGKQGGCGYKTVARGILEGMGYPVA